MAFMFFSGGKAKAPFGGFKWKECSTNDPKIIRELWKKYPTGAPAIDCGKSGFVIIDADCKDGKQGVSNLDLLIRRYGSADEPVIRTQSNGHHRYFRQRSDREPLGNGMGDLPKDIDVRGSGGYILAPGAIIETGNYELISGDLANIPEVPEWLYDLIKPELRARASPNQVELSDIR